MKNHTLVLYFIVAPTLVLQFGASCLSTGGASSDTSSAERRYDDRVPKDAKEVADGVGKLSYRAETPGRLYVYDATAGRAIFDSDLRRDERFTLTPADDRADVDGVIVFEKNVVKANRHRLYFRQDARGTQSTDRDRDAAKSVDERIPTTAGKVAEGKGSLAYRATEDGRVYLYDYEAKNVVFERTVSRGQRISIDADRSRITLDGKEIFDGKLRSTNTYRLYFNETLKENRSGY